MFRSGPASTTSEQSTAHADTTAAKGYEVVNFGYRRVCWLGWDGSFKEGLEGRQDFSSWLCPEVIRALEAGEGRSTPATTTHLAGYWVMEFADPSTCAVISNTGTSISSLTVCTRPLFALPCTHVVKKICMSAIPVTTGHLQRVRFKSSSPLKASFSSLTRK